MASAQQLIIESGDAGKVVVGNTSVGIYKVTGPHSGGDPTVFIDVSEVPELVQASNRA